MVDKKELSILLITHKFREVTGYCDEITVLRKGRVAGGGRVADLSVSDMATLMMGEQRLGKTTEKEERVPGEALLEIKGLRADRDNGVEAVCGVDLTVRSGEIVGIAGISGNGQRELVEVLARYLQPWIERGQLRSSSGKTLVLTLIAIVLGRAPLKRVFLGSADNLNSLFETYAEFCTV